jgi:Rps23 Pro-64 3,4-dihydroxylase Tpa1-like proline 4-hydroxylase
MTHINHINPIDREALREQARAAKPVRNFCIDNFLDESFADSVMAAYPTFAEATKVGMTFDAVNEKLKVQVTDSSKFAEPIAELNRTLSSPEFLDLLSYVFDMPNLLADELLVGGGIHQTGSRGHLDVHVDFNYITERELHRRLNILIYFNKDWKPEYGGNIELWDADVKVCHQSFSPIFNRCVVFETNEISYHGVTAVKCPPDRARKSFAAYYYTKEAPAHWTGHSHSTIFKARPNEVIKGNVMMPLEKAKRKIRSVLRDFKKKMIKS